MMIPVKYKDGRHDMVKPQILDHLLDRRKLEGFKRRSGWVEVGRDPIRGQRMPRGRVVFHGSDRRAASS